MALRLSNITITTQKKKNLGTNREYFGKIAFYVLNSNLAKNIATVAKIVASLEKKKEKKYRWFINEKKEDNC